MIPILLDRYTCEDNMEIVNSMNEEDIAPTIISTCQSNGKWSKDIFDYQCLDGSSLFYLMIYVVDILKCKKRTFSFPTSNKMIKISIK